MSLSIIFTNCVSCTIPLPIHVLTADSLKEWFHFNNVQTHAIHFQSLRQTNGPLVLFFMERDFEGVEELEGLEKLEDGMIFQVEYEDIRIVPEDVEQVKKDFCAFFKGYQEDRDLELDDFEECEVDLEEVEFDEDLRITESIALQHFQRISACEIAVQKSRMNAKIQRNKLLEQQARIQYLTVLADVQKKIQTQVRLFMQNDITGDGAVTWNEFLNSRGKFPK